MESEGMKFFVAFLYFILGLYTINYAFNLISLPTLSGWLVAISGALLVWAGVKHLVHRSYGGIGMMPRY